MTGKTTGKNTKPTLITYTAICGDYDKPREDYLCFTEKDFDKFRKPVMNAKIFKVLSHKFVDADISIWIDGNIRLRVSKEKLVELFLKDNDIAVFKHSMTQNVYSEARALRNMLEDQKEIIDKQVTQYKAEGFDGGILCDCSVLIRRNTSPVNRFNEQWWAEICRYSYRDQLSFPYVLWKNNLKVNIINNGIESFANPCVHLPRRYFDMRPHNRK